MPSVTQSPRKHQPSPGYSRAEQAMRSAGRGKPALWRLSLRLWRQYGGSQHSILIGLITGLVISRLSHEDADALVDDWLTTHEREAAEAEAEQLIAAVMLEAMSG